MNSREDVYLLKSVKMICTQFACHTGRRKTTVILTNPDTIEIYRRNHIAVRKVASNETDPSEKFSLPICFEILLHILSVISFNEFVLYFLEDVNVFCSHITKRIKP